MSPVDNILLRTEGKAAFGGLCEALAERRVAELDALCGSAYALTAAAAIRRTGGLHIFVEDDRDSAAYLLNDLYQLLGEEDVMFFPTSYKRSIRFGQQDASGMVQRTAALNAMRGLGGGRLVVCTYPEALVETVAERGDMGSRTIALKVGMKMEIAALEERLTAEGFIRIEFVYEPGQYSVRGGIVDIFSYSQNKPFRVDFFGDEIDSIRIFDIASQLSECRVESAEIIPDFKGAASGGVKRGSLAGFAGAGATYWMSDPDYVLRQLDAVRTKLLGELEEPSAIDSLVTSRMAFVRDTAGCGFMVRSNNLRERPAEVKLTFGTSPQPSFNKNFELLAANIRAGAAEGYTTYILSENKAQIERLGNIFGSMGERNAGFKPLSITLHEGFSDNELKFNFYTDHQIFDRYQRYRLRGEINRSESLTVAELNALKPGDYVVHIDHGVGRFGGVVKMNEGGKTQEYIKLTYRDNDVLLVNVHSLHRIARYKSGDAEPPRVYKLGSGAWQKMKNAAKKSVKDIARQLIALYARRKASGGYAFSPDNYLQHELEASFVYEDTPDQQKAAEAVKRDMESPQPMDRLICGDVGFGKTEVAVRAAFKAVCDSKQVAVLVPTTILSLQHYRTFAERLRGFPVRIETLSRARSTKEANQIVADLAAGRIDILVGTHKILGKNVKFRDLGLLIVDEEQKFGVSSKEKLRQMSVAVDTLTLTATPIPRTLQFSLMGSRDLSIISTPPANRQPIETESHIFSEEIIQEAVEAELSRGGQVFFVHNRVEDIEQIAAMVRRLCPKARVAVGHGQMEPQRLEKLIMDFIYGEFDVLVATTIVENGIDIPNANTIIINDAHRFGLSGLHQLRGRVGRSDRKAYCYLLSPPDELLTGDARRRLRAIEEFSDLGSGFNIAMQDLDIRGAGNLLGAEQSGFIADIGFETYQKILNEAITELRAEGLVVEHGDGESREALLPESNYVDDCAIETDKAAYIPDEYVGLSTEKIKLYRELDAITDEREMERFRARMVDRFGPLPEEVSTLINVVRLRHVCIRLGFEKAKVKNGLMILQFIGNQESPYFRSEKFMSLLRYVTERPQKFVLKQNNNRLALTVREVKDMKRAWEILTEIDSASPPQAPQEEVTKK